MKKMMTMMAVVLMAGMMQAATINWGSFDLSNVYSAQNPASGTLVSGTVFVYLLSAQTSLPTYSGGAWNLNGAQWAATGVIDADGSALGAAGMFAGAEGGSSTGVADALYSSLGWYAAVLVTQTGKAGLGDVDGGSYYVSTGVQFDLASKDDANKNGTLYFTQSVTGGSWTAVPEPTSMALLALGAAALGLRRKFRA